MAPLKHRAVLGHQRERPLLRVKLGAFLNPDFRPIGSAPESGEAGDVDIEMHRIIAPVAGGDHAAIEVEDALQLAAIEGGEGTPIPQMRKRRYDAQALFAFGAGARLALNWATSLRSAWISASSSASRLRPGSKSSPQGVP